MTHWSSWQKILFRFVACYFFLFCMSNQFVLTSLFDPIWREIVPWFAKHVLQLENEITVFTNGSGDTTYNYVSLLVYIIISLIATLTWTLLDRNRENYNKLLQWFLILLLATPLQCYLKTTLNLHSQVQSGKLRLPNPFTSCCKTST